MNINELTIGQAKELSTMLNGQAKEENNPYTIGKWWFFRTVTHHLSGIVKSVGEQEIVLEGGTVCWIADDGRFTEFLKTGTPNESEIYGENDVIIGRGSIVDATELKIHIDVAQR